MIFAYPNKKFWDVVGKWAVEFYGGLFEELIQGEILLNEQVNFRSYRIE